MVWNSNNCSFPWKCYDILKLNFSFEFGILKFATFWKNFKLFMEFSMNLNFNERWYNLNFKIFWESNEITKWDFPKATTVYNLLWRPERWSSRYLHTSGHPYEPIKVDKRLAVVVSKRNDQILVLIGSQPNLRLTSLMTSRFISIGI